ncbi:hypothetical protein JCM11641_005120 [Rhodosporidiobolus odoratus]
MPPRSPTKASTKLTNDPTPLSLPALLKLLTTSGPRPPHLTTSQAIQLAHKLVPKALNSHAKLRTLTQVDLARIGVDDEELRKAFAAAMGKSTRGAKASTVKEDGGELKRKRPPRESDLDKPLPTRAPKETVVDEDFDFEEILAEEALVSKTVITNRAPVMTAWACVVAERLGFRRQEALSIAHVFTDMNASTKGVSLGIMAPDAVKIEVGPSQPFVELLGRKVPLLSTQHGEWRAISKGLVADPSKAFAYVRGAFRQQLGAVVGAMRLLAESFSPAELNQKGYGLYLDFRPSSEKWGSKAEMKMSTILELRRFLTHAHESPSPVLGGALGLGVKGEGEEDGVVKHEDVGEGVSGREGLIPVKEEEKEGDGSEDEPARKKVRVEGNEGSSGLSEVKPEEEKDEEDEFDALDDGFDYGAVEL